MLDEMLESATEQTSARDWRAIPRELGPRFAERAGVHDASDAFVAENYVELKACGAFSAGVPVDLGGGGATHAELCALIRELAHSCGATALALAMHTHQVAATVWRRRQGQPVDDLLRRIAAEQLVLVSTGASDWLESSGRAERVDGGYRVNARKIFGSGSPAGDLLITTTVYDDPVDGPTVLHFPSPMSVPGVTVLDNWRAMGMRGSGSNDVILENVFVPDSAVSLRRPRGRWHPFYSVIAVVAQSIVMSAYVGVAEAARELALQQLQRKREDPDVWYAVGEMENALATGQMAVQAMIDLCANYAFAPDLVTANTAFVRKTIATQSLIAAVEKAAEAVGGSSFQRTSALERLLRDIHGAQFHPLQAKRQHRFTGRVAFGLDPVDGAT
ncbi:MAG TPA: acyl-CoA dehydrogenase family protein [Chloroflexota bacterium]|jgi:alkylation response protein AidB-like acyl-CoA dehydrogenase